MEKAILKSAVTKEVVQKKVGEWYVPMLFPADTSITQIKDLVPRFGDYQLEPVSIDLLATIQKATLIAEIGGIIYAGWLKGDRFALDRQNQHHALQWAKKAAQRVVEARFTPLDSENDMIVTHIHTAMFRHSQVRPFLFRRFWHRLCQAGSEYDHLVVDDIRDIFDENGRV